ncbi:putative transcriptional regulator SLK2 [Canna indica]|uniref:Transcriptional regulator SLK2 n=1 Tax=Canna indica TaxID=4628 RepID=A0AAQ3L0L6_9LILI|nr:putative transcriptional regulator SLK2 [Canna indica]
MAAAMSLQEVAFENEMVLLMYDEMSRRWSRPVARYWVVRGHLEVGNCPGNPNYIAPDPLGPAHMVSISSSRGQKIGQALDRHLNSSRQLGPLSSVPPSRVTAKGGGSSESSSVSDIFFPGDGGQKPATVSSMSGNRRSGLRPTSSDINQILNSTGNSSSPSVGASSLVTDANSALSGGSQLQRSTSFNNESYMRLPASPMSFSSNISGSSVVDGCSIVQQNSLQEQVQKQGLSTATSQLMQHEQTNLMNAQKKPRLDGRHEDALQQQWIHQLLLRREPMQQHSQQNLQLQSIIQQQRLIQQQQQQHAMQSFSQMQRPLITLQQQQQQLQQQRQLTLQPASTVNQPFNNGICSRRLMQYLYHQRQRPPDNSILYWTKFVTEYFAVRAKKRWCLSLYGNIGNNALGVFPQLSVDTWQCDICGCRSGKGFEATVEVLPRLFQITFDHGVIDENMFLGMPQECQLPSGHMILKYEKAIQESVFEHLRVVHEGQLRIIFTPKLKILSWEFCARRHEEFLPRRLVAPQVNQLLQVAQKYQAAVTENSSTGLSDEDLQSSCNMFAAAGRQLARNLDSQPVNDLGFSKRFVRFLQISEVVSSMKDLIDFSQEQKIGPIESLKNYPRQASAKFEKQKMDSEQLMNAHSLTVDQSSIDKVIGFRPGLNSHMNNNITAGQTIYSNQQSFQALNNYQNLLRNPSSFKQNRYQEAFSSPSSRDKQPAQFQGSALSILTNASANLSAQQQQLPSDGCMIQQNNSQTQQVNQQLQQRAYQQMLQERMNNKGTQQQSHICPNANANHTSRDVIEGGITGTPFRIDTGSVRNGIEMQNMPNSIPAVPNRTNSFKSVATANNLPTSSSNNVNSRPDLQENMDLAELEHIAQEFLKNGMFDGDTW